MTEVMACASLRTIDTLLPDDSSDSENEIDVARLPLSCERISTNVTSLSECALQNIEALMQQNNLAHDDEDALDDGFFLCDINVVREKFVAWRKLFPRVKPFFALKCNPDVMVAAVLGQHDGGAGFDCASLSEIKLALESTNHNQRRAESDLDDALALGVEALTFDGPEELQKIKKAHLKRLLSDNDKDPPEMILRILVPDGASSVPLGEKFGAPPSKVEALVREAMDLNLTVVGVSFHCGSGCHDPEAYGNAIKLAKSAIDIIDNMQYPQKEKCRLLDIGGGFPGLDGAGGDQGRFCGRRDQLQNEGKESLQYQNCKQMSATSDIATVVTPLLDELFPKEESPIQIISEPGRYFVESAFALCSHIYSVRVEKGVDVEHARRHYYIAQGVHGVFKDVLLCGESFIPTPLQIVEAASFTSEKATLHRSTVHGPSGEEYDIVCPDCLLPELQVGDWLVFDRMGAYTLSIAARSGILPIRYVMGASTT